MQAQPLGHMSSLWPKRRKVANFLGTGNRKNIHVPQLDSNLLTGLPAFADVPPEQITNILSHATSRRYETDEIVFHEGHPAERFFLMMDGHVRVLRSTADGEEIIVMHIHSGSFFGIARALGRDTYPATAKAAGEVFALSWPSAIWTMLVDTYPGFANAARHTVGTRVEEMNTRLMEMATQQVEQRVASALLRMVQQSGKACSEGITISFPITRQNIADMTGSTLHTVSRLLSAWEKDGILLSARRKITLCQPERLVRIAGQMPMAGSSLGVGKRSS